MSAAASRAPAGDEVPSRRVLRAVEEAGEEHLGAVSSTAGFLPRQPPALALPSSHRAWDEIAAALPSLWRDMAVRDAVRRLPALPADAAALPDGALWRASVVLSALAYSFVRCDLDDLHRPAPLALPDALAAPWAEVSARLGRPAPHVAYDDISTYNWRLHEGASRVVLEDMELLVPLLGNDAERSFLCVNTEMLAELGPVVEAVVRAQEAVVADDRDALVTALLVVLERVRHVCDVSFVKIDPNPYGDRFADPVVWAKLVAPTGIPVVAGVPGVSGAANPGFQLVDTFLGRTRFASSLGHEAVRARSFFAPNVRSFLDAVDQVSVSRYVAERGDDELDGLFRSVLDAYAGERGYLGVHRRKVYGFIQSAFKVGRPATASGISGGFAARTWRSTDTALSESRDERYADLFRAPQVARLGRREPAAGGGRVQRVTLDVAGTGVVYRPGDRCAVLPRHTDALVERTLRALQGDPDRPVPLSRLWRAAVAERTDGPAPDVLPLVEVLRAAELRPLRRSTAKVLARVSGSAALRDVVEAREEDSLELWDALDLAAAAEYDVRRLWRAELWQEECLTRLLLPQPPRLYSVSGVPDAQPFPTDLSLTVGRLRFDAPDAAGVPTPRLGTGSTFLAEAAEEGSEVPVRVVRPLRFRLPDDPGRPVVLFAGGTGVAPFRGFVDERAGDPAAGETWVVAAARTRADLPYLEELERRHAEGSVRLVRALSREATDGEPARRVDAAMADPEVAPVLADLLRSRADGGREGVFYVCGQAAFAATVLDGLRAAAGGGEEGALAVRRLVGAGRLQTDLFTTFAPASAPGVAGSGVHDASELVVHNDDEHGWWTAISGAVYDMTEFRHLHPGGFRIVDDNAGVDCTGEYEAVLHHVDSEIGAMLAMYKKGFLRRLDFGGAWGVAWLDGALRSVLLRDAFRLWLRRTYTAVELQNSFRNDRAAVDVPLTTGETGREDTRLGLMLGTDLQQRFADAYLGGAVLPAVEELWPLACGLLDRHADAGELPRALRALEAEDGPARAGRAAVDRLADAVRDGSLDAAAGARLLRELFTADEAALAGVKAGLREGLRAFEVHEAETRAHGRDQVLGALRSLIPVVAEHGRRVSTAVGALLPPAPTGRTSRGADPAPARAT